MIKFAVDGGCHMWAGNAYSSGAPGSAPGHSPGGPSWYFTYEISTGF